MSADNNKRKSIRIADKKEAKAKDEAERKAEADAVNAAWEDEKKALALLARANEAKSNEKPPLKKRSRDTDPKAANGPTVRHNAKVKKQKAAAAAAADATAQRVVTLEAENAVLRLKASRASEAVKQSLGLCLELADAAKSAADGGEGGGGGSASAAAAAAPQQRRPTVLALSDYYEYSPIPAEYEFHNYLVYGVDVNRTGEFVLCTYHGCAGKMLAVTAVTDSTRKIYVKRDQLRLARMRKSPDLKEAEAKAEADKRLAEKAALVHMPAHVQQRVAGTKAVVAHVKGPASASDAEEELMGKWYDVDKRVDLKIPESHFLYHIAMREMEDPNMGRWGGDEPYDYTEELRSIHTSEACEVIQKMRCTGRLIDVSYGLKPVVY